jgi:hypothetical protein
MVAQKFLVNATLTRHVNRTTSRGQAFMPGFGGNPGDANPLGDREIVLLANYVLERYGRPDTSITENQVAEVRRGGSTSALVTIARIGVFVGVVALLLALIVAGLFKRKRLAAVSTNRMPARR